MSGTVHRLHVSQGGVPKRPVPFVDVTRLGIRGDAHNDTRFHGGPDKAVCLLALEVIEALRGEGHPIEPGSTGENLTVSGLGLDFPPGAVLRFAGGVELEITQPTTPCRTIQASFRDADFGHLHAKRDPRRTRHYARVRAVGRVTQGEGVTIAPVGLH